MLNTINQLKINYDDVQLYNYQTNTYYGYLSEFDARDFEDYEIKNTKIEDNLLCVYIQQIEI